MSTKSTRKSSPNSKATAAALEADAPKPAPDLAALSDVPGVEAAPRERRSPVALAIRIITDNCELGLRGKVRFAPTEQAQAAINAGDAVEASAADRAIAGV